MLEVDILEPNEVERATRIFHRDGFVCVKNALTPKQFETVKAGADRISKEQTTATRPEDANRGLARYSFGDQCNNAEWAVLVDLPTILPIVEAVFGSPHFYVMGAGGDYSLPGAKIQGLHADVGDFFKDPLGKVTFQDVPTPFIVVNFLMVDFTRENGAIRFVPTTQRSRAPIPKLEDEPAWMQHSILCAPAGTAVIRDVRCWHGGTANTSNQIRPMTSVGYNAPWYRVPERYGRMPRRIYQELSPRGQKLCEHILES